MRVGVTGASGFIGSAVCRALGARGDEVVRFVRPQTSTSAGPVIRWDPSRGEVDEGDLAAVGSLDGVIHLAGAGIADHRWSPAYRASVLESRTTSTALLVQALRHLAQPPATVVSGSAIGYYGSRGDEVLTETSTPGNDYVAEVCQAWESAAAPLVGDGIAVSFARTGIVLGPEGGVLGRLLPLFRFLLGGDLGSGRQWMSPIALADEVAALLWALDGKVTGPFNVTAPSPCTNHEFTKALASQVHRVAVAKVPAAVMRLAMGTELANNTVLASQRVVPEVLLASGFQFTASDITSILRTVLA